MFEGLLFESDGKCRFVVVDRGIRNRDEESDDLIGP